MSMETCEEYKDIRIDEFGNKISALFCFIITSAISQAIDRIGYSSRCSIIWSDQCVPLSRGTLLRAAAECQWSI